MAVGGHVGDATALGGHGVAQAEGPAAQAHLAAGRLQSGERAQELRLAVAGDPGEADDLARRDGQAHALEGVVGQVLHGQAAVADGAVVLAGEGGLD